MMPSSTATHRKHSERKGNLGSVLLVLFAVCFNTANAFNDIKSRAFLSPPHADDSPKLILISGSSGTGKSTFGMSVALDQGILNCVSTETLRSVMQSFIDPEISPALHRSSSFEPTGQNNDPVKSWRETCTVLEHSVEALVEEMTQRGVSLVVEGVHLVPSKELIQKWETSGGVAIGILLTISSEETHKSMLLKRGTLTGQGEAEDLKAFQRVRVIQDEMIRLAREADWLLVEQNLQPDPLEAVASSLWNEETVPFFCIDQLTSKYERRRGSLFSGTTMEPSRRKEA
jgi:2-phosphoglycerate kinase